jgi:hypothetical protein
MGIELRSPYWRHTPTADSLPVDRIEFRTADAAWPRKRTLVPVEVDSAENLDFSRPALGYEEVAVRRGANEARLVQISRVEFHSKPQGSAPLRICGTGHE